MLLSTVGNHVQLSKIDGSGESHFIFPANTADDVVVDENGVNLTSYLPTITTDLSKKGSALTALESGTVTIDDTIMAALTNA